MCTGLEMSKRWMRLAMKIIYMGTECQPDRVGEPDRRDLTGTLYRDYDRKRSGKRI